MLIDILSAHDTSFFVSDDESQDYASLAESTFNQMNTDDVTVTTYKNGKVCSLSCLFHPTKHETRYFILFYLDGD